MQAITPRPAGGLRLAFGTFATYGSAEYGRLEIFHDGGCGTKSDNAFTIAAAGFNNPKSLLVAKALLTWRVGVQVPTVGAGLVSQSLKSNYCQEFGSTCLHCGKFSAINGAELSAIQAILIGGR